MKVGYARTSSIDGSQRTGLETQIEILKRHGCERIFAEEQSGTSTDNRKQLKECLEFMREGDCCTFTMVDRVCRNSYDLQCIVKDLTERAIYLEATEQPISTKHATSRFFGVTMRLVFKMKKVGSMQLRSLRDWSNLELGSR